MSRNVVLWPREATRPAEAIFKTALLLLTFFSIIIEESKGKHFPSSLKTVGGHRAGGFLVKVAGNSHEAAISSCTSAKVHGGGKNSSTWPQGKNLVLTIPGRLLIPHKLKKPHERQSSPKTGVLGGCSGWLWGYGLELRGLGKHSCQLLQPFSESLALPVIFLGRFPQSRDR